jgi:hypothetical protein
MKENISLYSDSPMIFHPHYLGEEKLRIKAIVRFPDGRLTEMEGAAKETESSFIRDVFAQYSEEEIDTGTTRELRLREAREELDKLNFEDREKDEARAALFKAKAKTLEIPEVKACPDAALQLRIRKARSEAEVYSLAALAMLRSEAL